MEKILILIQIIYSSFFKGIFYETKYKMSEQFSKVNNIKTDPPFMAI